MSGSIGKNCMFNTRKKEDVQAIRSAHKPFTGTFSPPCKVFAFLAYLSMPPIYRPPLSYYFFQCFLKETSSFLRRTTIPRPRYIFAFVSVFFTSRIILYNGVVGDDGVFLYDDNAVRHQILRRFAVRDGAPAADAAIIADTRVFIDNGALYVRIAADSYVGDAFCAVFLLLRNRFVKVRTHADNAFQSRIPLDNAANPDNRIYNGRFGYNAAFACNTAGHMGVIRF